MPEESSSHHEKPLNPSEQRDTTPKRWSIKHISRLVTKILPKRSTEQGMKTNKDRVDQEHQTTLIDEYINRFRFGQPELGMGETLQIPTTVGTVNYSKEDWSWTTDRDKDSYDLELFSDEFENFRPDKDTKGTAVPRTDKTEVIAGGKQFALGSGRVVLDIASGEAVALLQYSREFPETTFIGVDSGYEKFVRVDLNKPGVQLSKDDWSNLASIPDNSVDTILSIQGAFRHGVGHYGDPKEGELEILKAMTRVAKSGAILRYDIQTEIYDTPRSTSRGIVENNSRIAELLNQLGWKVTFTHNTAVAVKS